MNRFLQVSLFAVLALGACLTFSTATRGDDEEDKVEKEAIAKAGKVTDPLKKLIDAVETGKDKKTIDKAVADADKAATDPASKAADLKVIMWAAYKPRAKSGLGVGDKPDTIRPDGIEAKLINMAKRPMTDAQLEKEGPALIKMGEVARAMAEVAEAHTPAVNLPKKPIADWTKFNKAQRDAAKDFIDAVKAKNPDKVLDATKNLYGSCTNCHSTFRDN